MLATTQSCLALPPGFRRQISASPDKEGGQPAAPATLTLWDTACSSAAPKDSFSVPFCRNCMKTGVTILATLSLLVSFLSLGSLLFVWLDSRTFMEEFYFCFITATSIGFGDIMPVYHSTAALLVKHRECFHWPVSFASVTRETTALGGSEAWIVSACTGEGGAACSSSTSLGHFTYACDEWLRISPAQCCTTSCFSRMAQGWMWAVVVTAMVVVKAEEKIWHDATPGMKQLEEFISNNTEALCMYVKCQEPFDATGCQENSVYLAGAGQFGCCGACVTFKKSGDAGCTGSIDPAYSGGYAAPRGSSWPGVEQDLEESLESSNYVSSSWCDYGLTCNYDNICEAAGGKAEGGCLYVRQQYYEALESGSFKPYRDDYRWPPSCTQTGEYAAVQYKGPPGEERYVCVDPAGNTVFGRIFPWQEELVTDMNCKCARRVWERQQAGESSITLHCIENGNYDALQCEEGWCYCVHPASGNPYGTMIPEKAMHLLPCYNITLVGEQYLRRCESVYEAEGQLTEHMLAKGVHGPRGLYECDPDGSFNGEQCIHGQCRCYDKYMVSILKLSSGGGCNCARDQWLYDSQENSHVSLECATPAGVDSGLYFPYQYYGDTGVYCVDQDGVRASPVILRDYVTLLNCDEAARCQNGISEACEKACAKCKSKCKSHLSQNETNKACDRSCKTCPPTFYVKYVQSNS
ncbi:uncharacterized protein LOC135106224 [Scylla paramamosain]|uniref:uncharacterized protein LOC135106224 n=1 Tax=Scylla paramamosain TaxID=85552 RepID=UPI0030835FE4